MMASTDTAGLLSLLDPEFGIPPDVTFTCGEHKDLGEVHAHKIILALKSTVFKNMFYTPGERLETDVVTNQKAFKLMINFMYEKKEIWEGISLVELFQVAFLARKYNMEGLMDKVVKECRSLPSTGPKILDAASIAEEFQDLFPLAAEAVLEACTCELQQRLTAPEHFIQFASEHSTGTDPARSATAFRLLARLKKEKGPSDAPSEMNPTKLQVSKQIDVKKCKEILDCENAIPSKTGTRCSNCRQVQCLDGLYVMDIEKVTIGCQLRTDLGADVATVLWIHQEGYNTRPLKVKMGGTYQSFSLQTRDGHYRFNYDCGGKTESLVDQGPKALKPNQCSQFPPPPFSCTNCKQSPCLHNKPVLDTKKVSVGCHLLSASVGYFKDAAPMLAIVVKVDEPGYSTNPLRVEWQGGCPGSGNSYKKMQNCPIPTKAKHTPTFTYFCSGDL